MKGNSVVLRDGSVVLIRQVQPEDAPLFVEGFARLSAESRRLRFLMSKSNLTPAELRYFTEVDHHAHEALVALNPVDGRGLGVARYIRHAEDPTGAEVAVTVVDEWQRRGLGTELLNRLTDRAREEGIRHFTALVSSDNAGVQGLLRESLVAARVIDRESGAVEYEIPLPLKGIGDELGALLRAFGRRQVKAPAPIHDTLVGLTPEDFTSQDGH
ncbi:MAG TPA: GNAT family N-acetyltransferase [Dermatophilaceae bacterium]|nr:GNAT family N-acetyltransferase [Dermatophilaceae bacterium]